MSRSIPNLLKDGGLNTKRKDPDLEINIAVHLCHLEYGCASIQICGKFAFLLRVVVWIAVAKIGLPLAYVLVTLAIVMPGLINIVVGG